jgi:tyrosinase
VAVDVRRDQTRLSPQVRGRVKAALFAMKRMPLTRDKLAPSATDSTVYSTPDPPATGLNTPKNVYDQYVHWHTEGALAGVNTVHSGPMFLPWHRWLLRLFEMDLKRADYLLYNPPSGTKPPAPPADEPRPGRITLPYWDFCRQVDRSVASGGLTTPFTWDLIGNFPSSPAGRVSYMDSLEVGYVDSDYGDNDQWPIYFSQSGQPEYGRANLLGRLTRRLDSDTSLVLNDVAYAQRAVGESPVSSTQDMITSFDHAPWHRDAPAEQSFRNVVEGWKELPGPPVLRGVNLHNRTHMWVGGIIIDVPLAANDPVFFLLHANVDRLWSAWQFYSAQYDKKRAQYPPKTDYPDPATAIDADMLPWQAGTLDHDAFGKVVSATFDTTRIGPTKVGSGWATGPTTTGYRYDSDPKVPVLKPPKPGP